MKKKLSDTDRSHFEIVTRTAFSNPFSDEYNQNKKIASDAAQQIERLEEEHLADVRLYSGEDRQIVFSTFLFDAFHRFIPNFDQLIVDQIKNNDALLPAPFARDVFNLLTDRGFPTEGARHFFCGFYQMRRAYYFISQNLPGDCASMKTLRSRLWTNLFSTNIRWYEQFLWNRMEDFSTLLLGETGTGKGSAAAALGRSGYIPFDERRRCFAESFTTAFTAINLSQFSTSLLESELFGHKKGAFTGAIEPYTGLFARCSPHGAIFLDEIGDVAIPTQIKLLQILQDRTFSPVGSHEKLRFSGRVIAATNRPIDELRQRGEFRNDFYYRLSSDVITVPTLRQRLDENPNELKLLVTHLARKLISTDSPELIESLLDILNKQPGPNYPWPGNVRELEQAIRRILLTQKYEGDTGVRQEDARSRLIHGIDTQVLNAEELLSAYCSLLYQRHGTYEKVSEITRLDRRTAKKYIQQGIQS